MNVIKGISEDKRYKNILLFLDVTFESSKDCFYLFIGKVCKYVPHTISELNRNEIEEISHCAIVSHQHMDQRTKMRERFTYKNRQR